MFTAMIKVIAIFVVIFGVQQVVARPHEREKRVSDSHLSNLETISTLNKYKRRLSQTTPIDLNSIASYNINKRLLSSSYLSDLQTQIGARDHLKGIAIKIPIAGGVFNPHEIGRKRRSNPALMNSVLEQLNGYATEEPSYEEQDDRDEYQYPFLEYFRIAPGEDQEDS